MAGTEEQDTSNVSSRLKQYLKEMSFFCKIVQLLFLIIAVGLIVNPFNDRMQSNLNHAGVIYVALCGYILIDTILIISYLYGEKLGKKTALKFSAVGAIMCFTAGVILIYDWKNFHNNYISRYIEQYMDQLISAGVFAILASVIFAIETYYTYKYE